MPKKDFFVKYTIPYIISLMALCIGIFLFYLFVPEIILWLIDSIFR